MLIVLDMWCGAVRGESLNDKRPDRTLRHCFHHAMHHIHMLPYKCLYGSLLPGGESNRGTHAQHQHIHIQTSTRVGINTQSVNFYTAVAMKLLLLISQPLLLASLPPLQLHTAANARSRKYSREYHTQSSFNHKNIVKCFGGAVDGNDFTILMELLPYNL